MTTKATTTTNDKIVPCIWFDNHAKEAAEFYTRTFEGGRVVSTARYPETKDNVGKMPRGSILTVEFEILGLRFTALNGGPLFKPNPTLSFFVHAQDAAQVDQLCAALKEGGGKDLMAVGEQTWSKRYGWVQDKYGVTWQVMLSDLKPGETKIAPCLMFCDKQYGHAEQAMKLYTSIFANSSVDQISKYEKGKGDEDKVMHGRFFLEGQRITAMDAPGQHNFEFTEGLSLQVMCKDQAELDKYYDAILANGGKESQCGWVWDRFGLSWQIAPEKMREWFSGDQGKAERVFDAMIKMKRLNFATLEKAAAGK